ncbi:MAG: DNA polymerase III subunit gamma/tau [Desulfitobacterium hafniense]|nr:DNA polymerase III subunit gamma/tau [Desulfitobacterium hafniense]
MTYLALYRKWRPRTFNDIVSQVHITKTLTNALVKRKIAHAYLFSGPRGTGKTTTAKIMAKALNCENQQGFEPCNQCNSCMAIEQGIAMEVMEIDAASNRGIDEIRDLRDKVRLSAGEGKYKVYIIDEVHMLTTEAFNALLKTLEEPPPKVVFILATTEVHKIPLTILSRVQRFEFHKISTEDIQSRLAEICEKTTRNVTKEALMVIAQKSEGGLRDAISILDQCLLLEDPIGIEQVYQVLGMVGESFSSRILDALLTQDYSKVLATLSEGLNLGKDPRQILRELMDYLRQSLLYVASKQDPVIPPHLKEHFIEQSEKAGLGLILGWISVLLQGESQLKYAANTRLAAELLLVQAIYESNPSRGNKEQEIRLKELETEGGGIGDLTKTQSLNKALSNSKVSKSNLTGGKIQTSNAESSITGSLNSKSSNFGSISLKEEQKNKGLAITLDNINGRWPEVLEQVKKRKKSTHAFLMEGKPGKLDGDSLILVFKQGFSFHRDKVDQLENKTTVEEVLKEILGKNISIKNVMEGDLALQQDAPNIDNNKEQILVKKAEEIFGPELVVVKGQSN